MSDDIVKTLLESLTEEQRASLVSGLMKELATETTTQQTEETVSSQAQHEVAEDFTVTRQKQTNRKTPVKAKKNEWVDDGTFGSDIEFDYEKFEKMKTPRKRGKPNKKNVECHVCGKSFTMNANLIYGENIRCNRCTGN